MTEIYLDNCATTHVDADTAAVAMAMMAEEYGNPSSLHSKGLAAQLHVDKARTQLATALGCTPEEVLFTSGGTEANNLAILGGADALKRRGKTLVATAFEHSSVLAPLRALESQGFTLKLVPPRPDGTIDPAAVADAVDDDTILVSCMLINSEVGTILPIADIARRVRQKNKLALLHCDSVQAFGKLAFSVSKLGVDLLTVSGHKIHAPKGCGALYIRRGVRITPRVYGGSQERALRPGTECVPLIAAFGHAAEKAAGELPQHWAVATANYEHFVKKAATVPGLCINSPADATPYLCNISLPGYRSEILLHYLGRQGIYVSSGSACSKGAASHVLKAMGLPPARTDSALRISFSKHTTPADIDAFFEVLRQGLLDIAHH